MVEFADIASRWRFPQSVAPLHRRTGQEASGRNASSQADTQTAEEIYNKLCTIADSLLSVLNDFPTESLLASERKKAYFGNFRAHASLFRGDQEREALRPIELPSFSRMAGGIHTIYRVMLPTQLDVMLDVERLKPETREAVNALHDYIADYQKMPLAKRIARASDEEGERKVGALMRLELADSDVDIPLIAGGERISVPKPNRNLGLLVYGLELSGYGQFDRGKFPQEVVNFIALHVKGAAKIIKNIHHKFDFNPQLRARRDHAFAECLPKIQALLRTHGHSIQMINLLAKGNNRNFLSDTKRLLEEAGLPMFPLQLKSVQECALVLESLAERHYDEKEALLALALQLEGENGQPKPLDAGQSQMFRGIPTTSPMDIVQRDLCRSFFVRHGLMAGDQLSRGRQ